MTYETKRPSIDEWIDQEISDNSDAVISNCTFEGNTNGIQIRFSSPKIRDCSFIDTNRTAIAYKQGRSDPVLENNTYVSNRRDVTMGNPVWLGDMVILVVGFYMIPIILLVAFRNEILGRKEYDADAE
jgi:parallel beta-helix repeat protein